MTLTFPPGMRPSRPRPENIAAEGRHGLVSTSHPMATAAGVDALKRGGSAVDAYVAAAAVQAVIEPTMTGLGGALSMNVFDPAVGKSRLVGSIAGLPAAEVPGSFDEESCWSGRSFTTPGWVCGAHTGWKRWGKLPWEQVLAPAIRAAEEGFPVDQLLWGTMWEYRTVPGKYEAGRQIWFPGGRLVCVGEVLRQPALARTLQQVAELGPDHIYQGEFAKRYVAAAQAAGGLLTLDDMAAAQTRAVDQDLPPLKVAGGWELHTTGLMYALALNLVAAGGLERRALPTEDPDSLYLLIRIVEEAWAYCMALAGDGPFDLQAFEQAVAAVAPENAERLWSQVETGPQRTFDGMNMNTNGIVAADASGMVVHGTHSTSGTPFGAGFVVDGVIVARPLYYFARPMVKMPLGLGTSLLALKDGRPALAAACPSISAFQNIFQNATNVMTWGLSPGESVQQPLFGSPLYPSRKPMVETGFSEEVLGHLESRGVQFQRVSPWEQEMGSCHLFQVTPEGSLRGAADPRRLGQAAGL